MAADNNISRSPWEQYYGPNLGYIREMYEKYVENPETVDPVYRETLRAIWSSTFNEGSERRCRSTSFDLGSG